MDILVDPHCNPSPLNLPSARLGVKITQNSKDVMGPQMVTALSTEGDKTTLQSMRYKLCSRGGHQDTKCDEEAKSDVLSNLKLRTAYS